MSKKQENGSKSIHKKHITTTVIVAAVAVVLTVAVIWLAQLYASSQEQTSSVGFGHSGYGYYAPTDGMLDIQNSYSSNIAGTSSTMSKSKSSNASESFSQAPTAGSGGSNDTWDSNIELTLNEEKLVYRANVTLETLNFDECIQSIKSKANEVGGIVYEESVYNGTSWGYGARGYDEDGYTAYLELRIPTSSYEEYLGGLGSLGHVMSSASTVENITTQYYDTKAELDAKEIQRDKLLAMFDQAFTISDMLEIEDRLTDVIADINATKTEVQRMDLDVAYSTVCITVTEVTSYDMQQGEMGFFEGLWHNLCDGLSSTADRLVTLAMFVARHLVVMIVLVAVVVAFLKVHKKHKVGKSEQRNGNGADIEKPELAETHVEVEGGTEKSEDADGQQ